MTTASAPRAAIALPARDEADELAGCLGALLRMERPVGLASLSLCVIANNSTDDTARIAAGFAPAWRARWGGELEVVSVDLPPERANAGWARRLALEAAAAHLSAPKDCLLSTDADTRVTPGWLARTLDHLAAGHDAIAGLARLDPRGLRRLPSAHRRRLAAIQRYENALTFLKARCEAETWPRHFYEGGASMALTLEAYRRIGGAPTPPVGEDKALFAAVRAAGGKVRHPVDVKVITSARLSGRAPGGASDTLAAWGRLSNDEAIPGLATLGAALGVAAAAGPLTFAELADETSLARALVAAARNSKTLALAG